MGGSSEPLWCVCRHADAEAGRTRRVYARGGRHGEEARLAIAPPDAETGPARGLQGFTAREGA